MLHNSGDEGETGKRWDYGNSLIVVTVNPLFH